MGHRSARFSWCCSFPQAAQSFNPCLLCRNSDTPHEHVAFDNPDTPVHSKLGLNPSSPGALLTVPTKPQTQISDHTLNHNDTSVCVYAEAAHRTGRACWSWTATQECEDHP